MLHACTPLLSRSIWLAGCPLFPAACRGSSVGKGTGAGNFCQDQTTPNADFHRRQCMHSPSLLVKISCVHGSTGPPCIHSLFSILHTSGSRRTMRAWRAWARAFMCNYSVSSSLQYIRCYTAQLLIPGCMVHVCRATEHHFNSGWRPSSAYAVGSVCCCCGQSSLCACCTG
jgi:hypothetical protein